MKPSDIKIDCDPSVPSGEIRLKDSDGNEAGRIVNIGRSTVGGEADGTAATDSLIEKLQAKWELVNRSRQLRSLNGDYSGQEFMNGECSAFREAITIIRQHESEQPKDVAGRETKPDLKWRGEGQTYDRFDEFERGEAMRKQERESATAYTVLPERCPVCGDRLIRNKRRVECGAIDCMYIVPIPEMESP